MRRLTTIACALFALTATTTALAQDEKTDAPAAEGDEAAAPKSDEAPADEADAPKTDKKDRGSRDEDADDGEDKDNVRFRGGFLAPSIGPAFGGDASGAMVGLFKLQLGAQINHYLGVIYDGGPIVAAITNGSDSAAGGFFIQNSALAVLTLGKYVYFDVGAGPSLDVYLFGEASPNSASAGSGAAPGIATKLALGFGGGPDKDNARRVAFKLSVDPHFTFLPGTALVYIPIGIGVEWF